MRDLQERIEGIGELESWETPRERVLVCFSFDKRAATQRDSIGIVCALSGKTPSDGYYRLIAPQETLKVQNLGRDQWVILAEA